MRCSSSNVGFGSGSGRVRPDNQRFYGRSKSNRQAKFGNRTKSVKAQVLVTKPAKVCESARAQALQPGLPRSMSVRESQFSKPSLPRSAIYACDHKFMSWDSNQQVCKLGIQIRPVRMPQDQSLLSHLPWEHVGSQNMDVFSPWERPHNGVVDLEKTWERWMGQGPSSLYIGLRELIQNHFEWAIKLSFRETKGRRRIKGSSSLRKQQRPSIKASLSFLLSYFDQWFIPLWSPYITLGLGYFLNWKTTWIFVFYYYRLVGFLWGKPFGFVGGSCLLDLEER